MSGVVVLLSGGLDSLAVLDALAGNAVLALTFDYGQRARVPELYAAQAIAVHYGVPHDIVTMPWLSTLLPPAMAVMTNENGSEGRGTDSNEDRIAAQRDMDSIWIPNRNGVFLNIAAAYAEKYQATAVAFGANADEAQDFSDNTAEYAEATSTALGYSTRNKVEVLTPVMAQSKCEMVNTLIKHDAPLSLIWSCYSADTYPHHCGQCASCVRLKEAIQGVPAPILFK